MGSQCPTILSDWRRQRGGAVAAIGKKGFVCALYNTGRRSKTAEGAKSPKHHKQPRGSQTKITAGNWTKEPGAEFPRKPCPSTRLRTRPQPSFGPTPPMALFQTSLTPFFV